MQSSGATRSRTPPGLHKGKGGLRLFCLPDAGGSARMFHGWSDRLPGFVHVCPLELPGRGMRAQEEPLGELETVMSDLLCSVLPRADGAIAILGYGYGALLGFELAGRLEQCHGVVAKHVFVAAMRAPMWPRSANPISMLTDDQFREYLGPTSSRCPDPLARDDVMASTIRVLRADFGVADNYLHAATPRLSCRMTAFHGVDDPVVSSEAVQAWKVCTTGAFNWYAMPGDHFFPRRERELLLWLLAEELLIHSRVTTATSGQYRIS